MNIDIIDIDTVDATTVRIDGTEFAKANCSVSAYGSQHAQIVADGTTFLVSHGSAVDGRRPVGQTALLFAIRALLGAAVVSVKDFGAVGDGATNDTTAIQAAIAATPVRGTLVVPPGVFLINQTTINKTLNLLLYGELKRDPSNANADWVLNLNGDDSSIWGPGKVNFNAAGGATPTGRGEAIRLNAQRIYASGVTAANTYSLTGNGWQIYGKDCTLDSCRAENTSYAGVRTGFGTLDGSNNPVGTCTIRNFVASGCRRGWVNNGHADSITIDNFRFINPTAESGLALLGESGADVRFNTLNISNTTLRFVAAAADGVMAKMVGVRQVNLSNVTIDVLTSSGVVPLVLENEHAGTITYQENQVSAVNCTFRAYNTAAVKANHEKQWRWIGSGCRFIRSDAGTEIVDANNMQQFFSTDDEFVAEAAQSGCMRVNALGADSSRKFVIERPLLTGTFTQFFRIVSTAPLVGQITLCGAKFNTQPTASSWFTATAANDAKVCISPTQNTKGVLGAGRDFSALEGIAAALVVTDYAVGDRVWTQNVGDTGAILRVRGATVWRTVSA